MILIEHFYKHQNGVMLSYVKEAKETENLIIIRLTGPIDMNTVPLVYADLRGKLNKYLDKNILLDFNEVSHVDSATVANLIFLLNQLQRHHRKLGLTNVSPDLENYIDIDRIQPLIHIYQDEVEALKALL